MRNEFSPSDEDLMKLRQEAFGRCLNLGTGPGASAIAMCENPNVTEVVTVECNPKFYPLANRLKHPKLIVQNGGERPTGHFDYVFIDHFPDGWLNNRLWEAKYWSERGAVVFVDDI